MPAAPRRLSPQTLDVLTALEGTAGDWLYGLEIAAATGLKSGSLYPILARLADHGLLEGRWVEADKPGRPRRHAYRLTGAGRAALRAARIDPAAFKLGAAPA
jgi:DNA-binding PadR family transcriptional regulator